MKGIIVKEIAEEEGIHRQTCIMDINDIVQFSAENGRTYIRFVRGRTVFSCLADVEFNDFIRLLEDAERSP